MHRIAIIEDVAVDSERLKTLIEESLDAVVFQAHTRPEAEDLLRNTALDLVIMDIELGTGVKNRYAGFGLLSDMRDKTWPTIVVSGGREGNLHGLALTLHAYEFVSKPWDDQDLIHKIEHALQWTKADADRPNLLPDGLPPGLTEDPRKKNRLLWKGRQVQLTITELSIVQCLIENPGTVVENRHLLANLKSAGSLKAVAAHVSGVRGKFREVDPEFDRIDNEPGKGYVWKMDF